jgi:hypothetical protein
VADPKDELVHLYEIRDALAEHFGSTSKAQSSLALDGTPWNPRPAG